MNERQVHVLKLRSTDTEGALKRLGGDERVYEQCLRSFQYDSTVGQLDQAIFGCFWEDAFTAAHALKGMAGNMGFVPLMHSTGQLLVLIRGGRMQDIPRALEQVNSSYRDIMDGIDQYFAYAGDTEKENRK